MFTTEPLNFNWTQGLSRYETQRWMGKIWCAQYLLICSLLSVSADKTRHGHNHSGRWTDVFVEGYFWLWVVINSNPSNHQRGEWGWGSGIGFKGWTTVQGEFQRGNNLLPCNNLQRSSRIYTRKQSWARHWRSIPATLTQCCRHDCGHKRPLWPS